MNLASDLPHYRPMKAKFEAFWELFIIVAALAWAFILTARVWIGRKIRMSIKSFTR